MTEKYTLLFKSRVRYRLNFINSDSAYRFRFLSIPSFNFNVDSKKEKKKVKHLDIKHIYSVALFAKHLIAAEYHEQI